MNLSDIEYFEFMAEDDKYGISLIPYFGYDYYTNYEYNMIKYERQILFNNMKSILNDKCIIKIQNNNTYSYKLYEDGFKYHFDYKVIKLNKYCFKVIKVKKDKQKIYPFLKELYSFYVRKINKEVGKKTIKKIKKFLILK